MTSDTVVPDPSEWRYSIRFARDCRFRSVEYKAGARLMTNVNDTEGDRLLTLREAVEAVEFEYDMYWPDEPHGLGNWWVIEPEPPAEELAAIRRALEEENPEQMFSWSSYPDPEPEDA